MATEMVMPQMGESITEAKILKWRVKPGDKVERDQVILEISTDKVDSEIPAPASGYLSEILYKEGDVVPVKKVIAIISESANASKTDDNNSVKKVESKQSVNQVPQEESSRAKITKTTAPPAQQASGVVQISSDHKSTRFISPLVKSLAAKHNLSDTELGKITGSGSGGRITKQDLTSYVEQRGSVKPVESGAAAHTPQTNAILEIDWGSEVQKIVPMDNMRAAIAEHMVRSKHTSPHVYSIQEVDVTNISRWRKANKQAFEEREGFSLSFTPIFLEAAVKGILQFPFLNASVDGKNIVLKRHINLGCAVALGTSGLIVPVIKRAEEKTLVGIARDLNDLATRARNKKLMPDDVVGGTFTVTNVGGFGTVIGTPIINQPQVAILCLGAIVKRPVVVDDMIAIREMCYLTLSYDHRIIDGALGGGFLAFIRNYLEKWDLNRALY
ncbi:MAG TPA: dihydrolipoamide acetyltransferase family protein [Oligoflexia bacterium]|nr:dihydrolipoamide acetyltransferase family protein [Oligoflexia bacterium]HMP26382.1 dihydrolipoamide acetyltransferase family protein [Oligoflexia bacterium]